MGAEVLEKERKDSHVKYPHGYGEYSQRRSHHVVLCELIELGSRAGNRRFHLDKIVTGSIAMTEIHLF